MKPTYKSNAGQIVNTDEKMKLLSDYIKQAQKQEAPPPKPKTFDEWLDEPRFPFYEGARSRRELWEDSEIEAARLAWEEARK